MMKQKFTRKSIFKMLFVPMLVSAALVSRAQAPANDLCSGATVLTPNETCISTSGTTVGATSSGNYTAYGCEQVDNYGDIWYRFVATNPIFELKLSNITATNSDQASFLYGISLLEGDCGAFTDIDCGAIEVSNGNDSIQLTIYGLFAGSTYYIRIWKDAAFDANNNEIQGDFTFDICMKSIPPPPNDSCANAMNIPLSSSEAPQAVLATLVAATADDPNPPSCSQLAETEDVWFNVTVPASGELVIQTDTLQGSSTTDLAMEVFSGSCESLSSVGCNDDVGTGMYMPALTLSDLTPGENLLVRIVPYGSDVIGEFKIAAWDPQNDPLNVELSSISAKNTGSVNQINWTVASENKSNYFILERSADGKSFNTLSEINKNGKTSDYVYQDKAPFSGINYYRLKLMNAEGKFTYSKIVQATLSTNNLPDVEVFPNPATKYITVRAKNAANGNLTLTDVSGRTIYQTQMKSSQTSIDLSSFANGFYLLHYVDSNLNKVIKIHKK